MDNNKNKPVEGELDGDKLAKELEEIRDMFQEAIDNAANENEHNSEPADEFDITAEEEVNYESTEETQGSVKICECCGKEPCSIFYGEDYPYCDSCREMRKRFPIRISGVITMAVMIAVFFISGIMSIEKFDDSILTLDIWQKLGAGQAFSAADAAYSVGIRQTDSKSLEKNIIESYWRAGYITNATNFIKSNYDENEIKKNKKYSHLIKVTEIFAATKEKADALVSVAFAGGEYDYDEVMKSLDELAETKINETSEKTYSRAFISYYKNELMRMNNVAPEKQLEMLLSVDEQEQKDYQWIYYPAICSTAARAGNEKVAKEYFEKIRKYNSQDLNAYVSMASYYRYLDEPDAEKILELCQEASKHSYGNDIAYYPTMAIAYIIKGEGALALETMQTYMSSGYYTVANCNLYAVCGLYCGDEEIYTTMKETLENSGYKLSDVVEDYKNEKLTIKEVIADKRGDLG